MSNDRFVRPLRAWDYRAAQVPEAALTYPDKCPVDVPSISLRSNDVILVPYDGELRNAEIVLPASDTANGIGFIQSWLEVTEENKNTITYLKGIGNLGEQYASRVEESTRRFKLNLEKLASQYRKVKKYEHFAGQLILEKQRLIEQLENTLPPGRGFVAIPESSKEQIQEQLQEIQSKKSSKARRLAKKRLVKRVSYAYRIESNEFVVVGGKSAAYLRRANKIMLAVEITAHAAALLTAEDEVARKKAFVNVTADGANAAATAGVMKLCVVFGLATGGFGFLACGIAAVGTGIFIGNYVDDNLGAILQKPVRTEREQLP